MARQPFLPARLIRRVEAFRGKHALEADFARLMRTRTVDDYDGPGPAIGIAALGSGPWHLTIELLLAHALGARGARPELLVCDVPELPICDERTVHAKSIERCAGCVDDKRALLDAGGIPWRGVSSLIRTQSLAWARAAVAALPADALVSHVERGWPIGQWLHVSGCHYLRCDERGESAEKIDTRRRLLASAIVMVEAAERWLDRVQPERVIVESGAHLEWRVVFELARARGIPVICREMGKGGWDHHLYALNRDCMSPDLSETWSAIRHDPLSDEGQAAAAGFIHDLAAKTFLPAGETPASRHRPAEMVQPGTRVAVAFANVTWDLATAGRDVAFDGLMDWLRDTVRALGSQPGVRLIIRAHPAEAQAGTREPVVAAIEQEWPDGHPGMTIIAPDDPVPARDLIAGSDLVLVYNSTTGLEAAAAGAPVLLCGAPHFRGKGFTIDVETREQYRELLSAWAAGTSLAPPRDAAALAHRYAHLFFLRYHVPMGWTTSELAPPFTLMIQSLGELLPGRNAALDAVCDGILRSEQVLLPGQAVGAV